MESFKDKLMMMFLAVLLAILFLIVVAVKPENKERAQCQDFCKAYDSDIRVFDEGICICRK